MVTAMSECRWNEGLSGSYCQTHFAYTEDMGVCHVADLIERAERAEAAIKRVREIQPIPVGDFAHSGWNACLAAVLRALDVPCPTCSGPIRETVGLVCQTCGTDYGAGDE